MHRTFLAAGALALGLLLASPAPAAACPKCKEALSAQSDGKDLERGFKYSILFMLSAPFCILGGLGSYFWWEVQRAQKLRDAQDAAAKADPAALPSVDSGSSPAE